MAETGVYDVLKNFPLERGGSASIGNFDNQKQKSRGSRPLALKQQFVLFYTLPFGEGWVGSLPYFAESHAL